MLRLLRGFPLLSASRAAASAEIGRGELQGSRDKITDQRKCGCGRDEHALQVIAAIGQVERTELSRNEAATQSAIRSTPNKGRRIHRRSKAASTPPMAIIAAQAA